MNKWALIFIFIFFIFYFYAPKKTPLENSIENAINYLDSVKTVNGSWEDMDIFLEIPTSYPKKTVGFADEWVTCYVGYNLKIALNNLEKCGFKTKSYDWNKTLNYILNHQRITGGWGFNNYVHSDTDSSAFCLLFLSEFNNYTVEQEKAANFIMAHQKEDGGFSTYIYDKNVFLVTNETLNYPTCDSSWCNSHPSVTAAAILALEKLNKTKYFNEIYYAKKYLLKLKTKDGFWEAYWWNDRIYSTYIISRALDITDIKTTYWLMKIQNRDGGWNSGLKNGSSVPFYTAIATQLFPNNKSIEWMLNNQKFNGSWFGYGILRLTESYISEPWINPDTTGLIVSDNGIFTTATVLRTLSEYYCIEKSEYTK